MLHLRLWSHKNNGHVCNVVEFYNRNFLFWKVLRNVILFKSAWYYFKDNWGRGELLSVCSTTSICHRWSCTELMTSNSDVLSRLQCLCRGVWPSDDTDACERDDHLVSWSNTHKLDEFCIWDTEGIKPTRKQAPPSHTVCDLNHSTNRVYTIGTKRSHRMWNKLICLLIVNLNKRSKNFDKYKRHPDLRY